MKIPCLLFLFATSLVAFADDGQNLLRNGDFSTGLSGWEGDCHNVGTNSDDSGATTGVTVKLRSGDWTQMTQDFDGKKGRYILTIAYTVTPGFSLSTNKDDYINVPYKLGYTRLRPFTSRPGTWNIIVNDLGAMHYREWEVTPTLSSGVQTVHTMVELDSDDSSKKGFYLCFPPGDGTINIQNITLVPSA